MPEGVPGGGLHNEPEKSHSAFVWKSLIDYSHIATVRATADNNDAPHSCNDPFT
jgi:hypothetical protein